MMQESSVEDRSGAACSSSSSRIVHVIMLQPTRSLMIATCPAIAVTVLQLVLMPSKSLPMSAWLNAVRDDEVFALFSTLGCASDLVSMILAQEEGATLHQFADNRVYIALRHAVDLVFMHPQSLWGSVDKAAMMRVDAMVTVTHFMPTTTSSSSTGAPIILNDKSVELALQSSRVVLEDACRFILEGVRVNEKLDGKQKSILEILVRSGLVNLGGTMTGNGLAFCMSEVGQQWSTLLLGAIRGCCSTMPMDMVLRYVCLLWQLDGAQYAYPFPARDSPLFTILVALVNVGLVTPIVMQGQRSFVLSPCLRIAVIGDLDCPWFRRALGGNSSGALVSSTGAAAAAGPHAEDEDTIITESNFRLYAYTRNRVLLNILQQFSTLDVIVDDWLVCCKITRDSFVSAVRRGISAAQVLEFLTLKAHSIMKKNAGQEGGVSSAFSQSIIPQSIGDQLRMWEADCRRVQVQSGTVLLSKISQDTRSVIIAAIEEKGFSLPTAIVYEDDGHMVVLESVYNEVVARLQYTTS